MRNLENRLNRLEKKIIGAGDRKNITILFINVGETEAEARIRHLAENPGAELDCNNSSIIIVQYV